MPKAAGEGGAHGGPHLEGVTRTEDADTYLTYLQRTGLAAYRATPGNRAAFAFRRRVNGGTEFLLLTLWDSTQAIRRSPARIPTAPCSIRTTIGSSSSGANSSITSMSCSPRAMR